jgi:hypothetical protein
MDEISHPSAFCAVLFGEADDVSGTLRTLKNIFDNANRMGKNFEPSRTKRRRVDRKRFRESSTPEEKTSAFASTVERTNVSKLLKVKVFVKNADAVTVYSSQTNACISEKIGKEMNDHVVCETGGGEPNVHLEVYVLERPKPKKSSNFNEPSSNNWWTDRCVKIWSTHEKTDRDASKSVVDQFREFGGISMFSSENDKRNRLENDKFDFCPILHCRSNSVFSKFDFERTLMHAITDDRIQTFDLKQCIKIDEEDRKRKLRSGNDEEEEEEEEEEEKGDDHGSSDDKRGDDKFEKYGAFGTVFSFLKKIALYFPFLIYAAFSFVALMCDHVEPNDHLVKTYLLQFKRKKTETLNKEDLCIACALSTKRTNNKFKKKHPSLSKSNVVKHHGFLRTSGVVYEYGTFFYDKTKRLCTNWNGSLFAIFYLLFDYAIWYRTYVNDRSIFGGSSEYLNYAAIFMILFYYSQCHYCFHFLKSINLIRKGKPLSFFNKMALIVSVSIVYPCLFIVFYPFMWMYRRFFSKRAWFHDTKCSRRVRKWVFSFFPVSFSSSKRKRSNLSNTKTFEKKKKPSSRWNCCCSCCRPEDEEDDADVIVELYSRFKERKLEDKNIDEILDNDGPTKFSITMANENLLDEGTESFDEDRTDIFA